ncbi:MAG: hypothetical protein D6725_07440 [Planctomycetota bacterium]|nr:MAG: hypothetical protein D6725_07440 [Planctomycetota bacterium]
MKDRCEFGTLLSGLIIEGGIRPMRAYAGYRVGRPWHFALFLTAALSAAASRAQARLQVGFAQADITPDVTRPVWLAGFGTGRKATGIHDHLFVRVVVLSDGEKRIALACADLIGLQYPETVRIRRESKGVDYVLVASTHNHAGPDVVGLWGPTPRESGLDPQYLDLVVHRTAKAIRDACARMQAAKACYGTAMNRSLLKDVRLPVALDPVLRVLAFHHPGDDRLLGIVVQWNCHPESMDSGNTLITADFVKWTVDQLHRRYGVPIVYVSGAIGGLLTTPDEMRIGGRTFKTGQWGFAEAYGRAVGQLAEEALQNAEPVNVTPISVAARPLVVPVVNGRYQTAHRLKVLHRPAREWTGDPEKGGRVVQPGVATQRMGVETEVACLRLGQLWVAAIPGELYPEMMYGQFQNPAEANVDFPHAPLEPTVTGLFRDRPFLFIGLANDEIGYILPKRQWDSEPPFAYGRSKPQYGEANSVGPDTAPVLMNALCRRAAELGAPGARGTEGNEYRSGG